jgi:hypothetical protein
MASQGSPLAPEPPLERLGDRLQEIKLLVVRRGSHVDDPHGLSSHDIRPSGGVSPDPFVVLVGHDFRVAKFGGKPALQLWSRQPDAVGTLQEPPDDGRKVFEPGGLRVRGEV